MSCCLKLTLDHSSRWTVNLRRQTVDRSVFIDTDYVINLSNNFSGISRDAFIHMMYDESATVIGSRIVFGLYKNKKGLDYSSSCDFKIYKVSNNATPWVNTLVKSGTLSMSADRLFKTTLTDVELGVDQQGDTTILVKATIYRGNEKFNSSEYFNHIGLTDKVERLRKKVVFLYLTKKSTGEP